VVALLPSDFHAWVRLCIAIKAASLAAAKEQLSSMVVHAGGEVDPRVESVLLDAAASSHESKSFSDLYYRWMMRMRSTSDPSPVPVLIHTTMEEEASKLSSAAIEALLRPYLSLKEHSAARHPMSRSSSSSSQPAAVHIFVTLDADASTTRTPLLPHSVGSTVSSSSSFSSSSSSSSKRRLSKSERKRLKSQSTRGPTQAAPIAAQEHDEDGRKDAPQQVAATDHHQTLHPVIALRYSLQAVTEDKLSIVLCTAVDTCLSYDTALRTR